MTYAQYDMPFSASSGIVPDIIMNPHAIPSRMTIGQLMECIMGKACCAEGGWGDATPFHNVTIHDIAEILRRHGMEEHGNEVLHNPRTGEQIPCAIFMGPTYYQRLKHMTDDKIHCLTEDHDVLTENRGWVPIADVTQEDKVATLQDHDKLVYAQPIEVLHFPHYQGKMYNIKNSAIDLNVTHEHRMLVSRLREVNKKQQWMPYELQRACDIAGKRVRYKKDAEWDAPDFQFVLPSVPQHEDKYPPRAVDMDAWLTFFGIWMAEGWAQSSKVEICIIKPRVQAVIHGAVDKLGLGECAHVFKDATHHDLRIYNVQLYAYMAPLSVGALNKRLPDWVWSLSKEQARKLMYAMMLGDGTWRGKVTPKLEVYYTSSTGLADDFQRLCLHAGLSAIKYEHLPKGNTTYINGRKVTNNAIVWRVSVIEHRNQPMVNHSHVKKVSVQEEATYDWEGPVYCLRVPGEVFYVRRNGKPCWTGNSRANNGPVVLLTRQPAEGRARDGGLRLGEMEVECCLSHGSMHFLKERFMECSDNYRVFVCKKCGMMATVNPEKNVYSCTACKNITHFAEVRIPYASKLLFQEVQTMGIGAKFLTH